MDKSNSDVTQRRHVNGHVQTMWNGIDILAPLTFTRGNTVGKRVTFPKLEIKTLSLTID